MTARRPRRGYTLVEMLLVISGVAVLFGITVGMIHMLLRLDRGSRERLGEKTTISRLARDVRRDAHAAASARPIAGQRGVALEIDERRRVEYIDDGGRLIRRETRGDDTPLREVYRLPSRGRAAIALSTHDDRRWLTITLEPRPNLKDVAPVRPVVVEAWVGKHRRLARAGDPR
jgi:type II secretory pathway component PulJ